MVGLEHVTQMALVGSVSCATNLALCNVTIIAWLALGTLGFSTGLQPRLRDLKPVALVG